MDEADVRAPALVALYLVGLRLSCRGFPEDFEVHVLLSQIPDRLAQLTGSHPPIEIHDRGRLPRRARHAPPAVLFEVCELRSMMKGQRPDVGHALHPAQQAIAVVEQAFRIALLNI